MKPGLNQRRMDQEIRDPKKFVQGPAGGLYTVPFLSARLSCRLALGPSVSILRCGEFSEQAGSDVLAQDLSLDPILSDVVAALTLTMLPSHWKSTFS
jgi:hypothetical protein